MPGHIHSNAHDNDTQMDFAAFLRAYQMRARNIMWLLGAGASRSAGVKTAGDMIWDFKQTLYRSQKKLPPSAIADTGDPVVQRKLQQYFDDLGTFPESGANDEYARFFEETFPSAKDRRTYLDGLIKAGKPSYGHHALALLMREGFCRIVWTTNFDRTIEDAAAKLYGTTGSLVVAELGEPQKVAKALADERFPLYGKIHGDYHSDALKNTSEELRQQDVDMRKALVQACQGNGLAVVGYSGRDDSVMHALREALNGGEGFPGGLFWFKRSGAVPYESVTDLIAEARRLGIDAHIIESETFDELMSDVVRFLPQTFDKLKSIQGAAPPRLASARLKPPGATTPSIRMNALPILSHPVMCRLIDCEIGGWQEIQEAIEKAQVDIDAVRIRDGVIAFGPDADIRKAFEPHGIKHIDTISIPEDRLSYENGYLTLVRESLFRALNRRPQIEVIRRGRRVLALPDTGSVNAAVFNEGRVRAIDALNGTVRGTNIHWTECSELRLDFRLGRLWLLFEPRIHREVPEAATAEEVDVSREFVRARLAARFNPKTNAIFTGWARLLAGTDPSIRLTGFGISDGLDPAFEISSVTGFSGVIR